MFKLLFLSLSALVSFSCSCMQNANHHLKPWVQAARDIHVKTSLKQINDHLAIDDNTTIVDVKRHIENREGISLAIQSLYALYSKGIFSQNEVMSERLPDGENVKQIMNLYNSRRFLLVLHINGPIKG